MSLPFTPPLVLLSRRALLAAAFAAESAAGALRVDPGAAPTPFRATTEGERFRLDFSGPETGRLAPILLPARRARLLKTLPLAGREVLAVAFAGDRDRADEMARGPLDLVALIGSDGMRLRILAVEMLHWQGRGGAGFDTMLDAPGRGSLLRFARVASPPQPSTASRHWIWADYLAWRQGAPLADAAPRPPRPETWQAALAAIRARITAVLTPPHTELTLNLLAPTGLLAPDAEIPKRPG